MIIKICPGAPHHHRPGIRQRTATVSKFGSLGAVLRRMGRSDITVHGFRSTFDDWAHETTAHPNHVIEQALAHAIPSAVEAAYRRGDLFEKRRALMDDWAAYLAKPAAGVVRPKFGRRRAASEAAA